MNYKFRFLCFGLFIALVSSIVAFAQPKNQYINVKNNANTYLKDIPCTVQRTALTRMSVQFLPILLDNQGNIIPTQVDDLDADGEWDELAFLLDLKKLETKKLKVKWVKKSKYPTFRRRANVRYGKTIADGKVVELYSDVHNNDLIKKFPCPYQMDGIAWENDKVGFRHYYDGRNCRDFFGKKTTKMVMDSVGIQLDGNAGDTYHVMASWGRDVLSVGRSLGIGGLAVIKNDSLIRLGVTAENTKDNVDSTKFTLINKGIVRGIFKLEFMGWEIGETKINVTEIISIWGGSYAHENRIINAKLPTDYFFVTGIVDSNNSQPPVESNIYGQKLMYTHDKQTYNKEFYLGLGLIIPESNFINSFNAPKVGDGITTTWCAKLKPDSNNQIVYYPLGGWEMQYPLFRDRAYFEKVAHQEALRYSKPLKIWVN